MLGNWLHPLQDCVAEVEHGTRPLCGTIIIAEMVAGSLLFLNLFLALLLSKFSSDSLKKPDRSNEKPKKTAMKNMMGNVKAFASRRVKSRRSSKQPSSDRDNVSKRFLSVNQSSTTTDEAEPRQDSIELHPMPRLQPGSSQSADESRQHSFESSADSSWDKTDSAEETPLESETNVEIVQPIDISERNAGTVKFFEKIVKHWAFDTLVLLVIGASSVALAWETSVPSEDHDAQFYFTALNLVFTLFFTVEIVVNCLGKGTKEYFTNGWDLVDFFIVIISWVDLTLTYTMTPGGSTLSTLRILRVLRAFRPLRAVKRWAGMRVSGNYNTTNRIKSFILRLSSTPSSSRSPEFETSSYSGSYFGPFSALSEYSFSPDASTVALTPSMKRFSTSPLSATNPNAYNSNPRERFGQTT